MTDHEFRLPWTEQSEAIQRLVGGFNRRPSSESVLRRFGRYDNVWYYANRESAEGQLQQFADMHKLAVRYHPGPYGPGSFSTAYPVGGDPVRDAVAVVKLRTPIKRRRRRAHLRVVRARAPRG